MKNYKKIFLVILWCCLTSLGFSETPALLIYPSLTASGENVSITQNDYGFYNPATLCMFEGTTLSTIYSNLYNAEGLNSYSFSSIFVTPMINFGILVNVREMDVYKESKYMFGYGMKFEKISLGMNLKVYSIDVNEIKKENRTIPGYDIGLKYHLTEKINISVLGIDLNSPKYNFIEENKIDSEIILGMNYSPVKRVKFYFEKNVLKYSFSIGAEVEPIKNVFFRGGINKTGQPSCGIGVGIKNLMLDIGIKFHQDLGENIAVGLNYKL